MSSIRYLPLRMEKNCSMPSLKVLNQITALRAWFTFLLIHGKKKDIQHVITYMVYGTYVHKEFAG